MADGAGDGDTPTSADREAAAAKMSIAWRYAAQPRSGTGETRRSSTFPHTFDLTKAFPSAAVAAATTAGGVSRYVPMSGTRERKG